MPTYYQVEYNFKDGSGWIRYKESFSYLVEAVHFIDECLYNEMNGSAGYDKNNYRIIQIDEKIVVYEKEKDSF